MLQFCAVIVVVVLTFAAATAVTILPAAVGTVQCNAPTQQYPPVSGFNDTRFFGTSNTWYVTALPLPDSYGKFIQCAYTLTTLNAGSGTLSTTSYFTVAPNSPAGLIPPCGQVTTVQQDSSNNAVYCDPSGSTWMIVTHTDYDNYGIMVVPTNFPGVPTMWTVVTRAKGNPSNVADIKSKLQQMGFGTDLFYVVDNSQCSGGGCGGGGGNSAQRTTTSLLMVLVIALLLSSITLGVRRSL